MHCQGSEFKAKHCKPQITHRTVFPTFYSLYIVFSFKHSLGKAPNLRLIFIRVADDHVPFKLRYYAIPKGPKGLLRRFLTIKQLIQHTAKFPLRSFNVGKHPLY